MYKFVLATLLFTSTLQSSAQTVDELRETARSFQRQGDVDNAILILNKAIAMEPSNVDLSKDLALTLIAAQQYNKANDILKPLVNKADADEQVFQLSAMVNIAQGNDKEADRIYKLALKKFPNNGMLNYEYGNLLDAKEPGAGKGVKLWETGVELDPLYPGNYFKLAKYHSNAGNYLWTILYGETFVNLESFTARTTEIKHLLLDGYKKMFVLDLVEKNGKSDFENSILKNLKRQKNVTGLGISAESLTALRARFILDWEEASESKFNCDIFNLHKSLLQKGLFEAYNQWLFGSVENLAAYQLWTNSNATLFKEFNDYQRNNVFRVTQKQFMIK